MRGRCPASEAPAGHHADGVVICLAKITDRYLFDDGKNTKEVERHRNTHRWLAAIGARGWRGNQERPEAQGGPAESQAHLRQGTWTSWPGRSQKELAAARGRDPPDFERPRPSRTACCGNRPLCLRQPERPPQRRFPRLGFCQSTPKQLPQAPQRRPRIKWDGVDSGWTKRLGNNLCNISRLLQSAWRRERNWGPTFSGR